jgi:hypothetical protein
LDTPCPTEYKVALGGLGFELPASSRPTLVELFGGQRVAALAWPAGQIEYAATNRRRRACTFVAGGPAPDDAVVSAFGEHFRTLAIQHMHELAGARIEVGGWTLDGQTIPTVEDGYAGHMDDWVEHWLPYPAPWQLLSPPIIARLGGPPEGATPLGGGWFELALTALDTRAAGPVGRRAPSPEWLTLGRELLEPVLLRKEGKREELGAYVHRLAIERDSR